MKIHIRNEDVKNLKLILPLAVIKMRFLRDKMWKRIFMKKSDEEIKKIVRVFYKELKKSKKLLNGMPIVDVEASDGSKIKIYL